MISLTVLKLETIHYISFSTELKSHCKKGNLLTNLTNLALTQVAWVRFPVTEFFFNILSIIEITDYHFSDDQLEAEIGQALAARHQEPSGELD